MYKVKSFDREFEVQLSSDGQSGTINGESFELDNQPNSGKTFHVLKENKGYNIELIETDYDNKKVTLSVNGNKYSVEINDEFDLLLDQLGMSKANTTKVDEIKSPMPGLVVDVLVNPGTKVEKGEAVLILEAMKMENIIKSPCDGVIKSINTTKGSAVEKNHILISFE
jgi:biotin carboxyl carrier protein